MTVYAVFVYNTRAGTYCNNYKTKLVLGILSWDWLHASIAAVAIYFWMSKVLNRDESFQICHWNAYYYLLVLHKQKKVVFF